MLQEIAAEELATALDRLADELLCSAGVARPPVDALAVAHSLGIQTVVDTRQAVRARYVELRGYSGHAARPAIVLRPEPRPQRRQWALAHELGEQQAHRVFAWLGVDPRLCTDAARETMANRFASRLLLPTRMFGRHGARCDWDLLELQNRFSTASHELILRRMLDFPPPVVVSIFDQGRLTYRGSNLAGPTPALAPLERKCWQAVAETGRADARQHGGWSVRGWAVHEEEWKRELLRTEINVDEAAAGEEVD